MRMESNKINDLKKIPGKGGEEVLCSETTERK